MSYASVVEMVRRGGSAPPASAMSVRRSADDLPARDAARVRGVSGGPGWIRTINLPIQCRTLRWLSYRAVKWSRLPVLPRSGLVYKTSAWLLCQAGMKWRKPEVMLPIPRGGTICFRNSPGALARFSFHFEIGESPRCCPVLRGLRMRGARAPSSKDAERSLHGRRSVKPLLRCKACDPKRKSVDMLHKLRLQLRPASNRRRRARPL